MSPVVTAATMMNQAAALMNDTARSIYTYTVQIPYLNKALLELQEIFELNNIPVTDAVTSSPIEVDAGDILVRFAPNPAVIGVDYLPDDLIEPKVLWVSPRGEDQYSGPVQRLDFLPQTLAGVEISSITSFVWQSQEIRFLPANTDLDIKIDYIRSLFTPFVDETDEVSIVNTQSFLEYKLAALLAQFVGENPSRATVLNGEAILALDRSVGIGTKGRQAINIRHRPFRSSYKRKSYM